MEGQDMTQTYRTAATDTGIGAPETVDSLQARLDAARARRAAAEERLESARKAAQLQREIDQEDRAAKEAEALEALEAEHGPLGEMIWKLETTMGMVVVKRPTAMRFRSFQDGKISNTTAEIFVRDFVVYPSKAEFNAIVNALPAIVMRCADACSQLAGHRTERDEVRGK